METPGTGTTENSGGGGGEVPTGDGGAPLLGGAGNGGAGVGTGGSGTGGAEPIPGFWAEYFAEYRTLAHAGVEPVVDFLWEGAAAEPEPGVGEDHFSARYTATLAVPTSGTYSFATNGDDGVRLWIGDELVIDDWRFHVPERHEGTLELERGAVPLTLEFVEADFGATLSLYWTQPGSSEELLDETYVTTRPGEPKAPKPPYRNAVIKSGCPDPGVLSDGNPPTYYMICTGGKFRIRRSFDLVFWESTENFVLPDGKPSWADNGGRNWAPEIHKVGEKYIVYFTSVNGDDVLSIGASWADDPLGPYTESGGPLVQHAQGVIDPHYFKDVDGKHYLTYKIDGNSAGQPTPIYIRQLAPDGLSFKEGSTQVEMIRNDGATWEGGVVEGQWIVERGGTYFLFYSGNVYDHRYRTGVARADNVLGPYTKHGDPILTNNDDWVGPGHGSVVPVDDDLYFVYHAWPENGSGQHDSEAGRHVLLDRITFEDNWPVIRAGSPSTTFQPWPGEE